MRRVFSPSASDSETATLEPGRRDSVEVDLVFLLAASKGDAGKMKELLDSGEVTGLATLTTTMGVSALMLAARCQGGEEAVQLLLDAKAVVDQQSTERSCTALALAAEEGQVASVHLLLAANAKLGLKDKLGYQALGLACENGHAETARVLLEAKADAMATRENGWTNIITAAYNGCTEVVKTLANAGADVRHATDKSGLSPIVGAAYNGFHGTVRELVKLNADVQTTVRSGWSVLMMAAVQGHEKTMAVLLELGADPNFKVGTSSLTPLMVTAASMRENNECTSILLQHKADALAVESHGVDALMIAARHGLVGTVEILLQTTANPRRARPGGATALMDAAAAGHEDVVRMLIDWSKMHAGGKLKLNEADENGYTALMHAAMNSHENAMLPLLQEGVDIEQHDKEGRTAVMHAASVAVVSRLLRANAKVEHVSNLFRKELGLAGNASGKAGASTKPARATKANVFAAGQCSRVALLGAKGVGAFKISMRKSQFVVAAATRATKGGGRSSSGAGGASSGAEAAQGDVDASAGVIQKAIRRRSLARIQKQANQSKGK